MPPNANDAEALELGRMADAVEQFLLKQVDRCELEIRRATAARNTELPTEPASNAAPAASIHQQHFQQEREAWEAERQDESERLQKEALLLQDAWQRLEEEQRRLLAERELVRRGAPAATLAPTMNSNARSSSAVSLRPVGHDDQQVDEQSAWLQFQRMRREIQSHSRPRP